MASHAVHLIIANSRVAAEEMAQAGYPRPRMMVIPNGTDVERFRPQVELGRDLRKEWGIPGQSKLIGMAARLDPMKDHATFVRAAQILALRGSDVHFVCVGEGLEPYRSAALATIGQAALGSRLQWRGQVRRHAVILFDTGPVGVVLGVRRELLECGRGGHVLRRTMRCYRRGGLARHRRRHRVGGPPPRDPDALAAAWDEMLGRVGPPLSAACRERIERLFSIERLVEATERALHDLRPVEARVSRVPA